MPVSAKPVALAQPHLEHTPTTVVLGCVPESDLSRFRCKAIHRDAHLLLPDIDRVADGEAREAHASQLKMLEHALKISVQVISSRLSSALLDERKGGEPLKRNARERRGVLVGKEGGDSAAEGRFRCRNDGLRAAETLCESHEQCVHRRLEVRMGLHCGMRALFVLCQQQRGARHVLRVVECAFAERILATERRTQPRRVCVTERNMAVLGCHDRRR